ncbi:MAG: hypothetical protein ABR577_00110 [Pyrinomonadaceae bacterium]
MNRSIFAAGLLMISFMTNNSADAQTANTQNTTAQTATAPQTADAPIVPAANPADVASLDAIMRAVYDVISGPVGKKRDWNRMRSLFIPGARLIPTGQRPTGEVAARVVDVEGYIARSGDYLEKNGFFEREAARRTEQYGNIAHVFSTYESRHKADDSKPFARGINSFQLVNDGKRWWVVTIFWQEETSANPLPQKYLETRN